MNKKIMVVLGLSLVGCSVVDKTDDSTEKKLYGTWVSENSNTKEKTEILFREDLTYQAKIVLNTEYEENGSWKVDNEKLIRTPEKCYDQSKTVKCISRNTGDITFSDDRFKLNFHIENKELGLDTTYQIEYKRK